HRRRPAAGTGIGRDGAAARDAEPRAAAGARHRRGPDRTGMTEQGEAQATQKDTLTVTVDGRSFEARPGELLIAAAERCGTYIPRFCWHPRMKPVGMCRMCLVDVQGPRGWALQPACMLSVSDGMNVNTQSPAVKEVQD